MWRRQWFLQQQLSEFYLFIILFSGFDDGWWWPGGTMVPPSWRSLFAFSRVLNLINFVATFVTFGGSC